MSRHDYYSSLVGHISIINQLRRMVEQRSLPHALLFCGNRGIGKQQVAQAVCHHILNAQETSDEAIATNLRLLEAHTHPDLEILRCPKEKRELGIEQIRTSCARLQLKPYYGTASCCIIDNAHQMSLSASNALLKTLEEPTNNSYLILVTDAPQQLPQTIISRTQQVYFADLTKEEINQIIKKLCPQLDEGLLQSVNKLCSSSLAPLNLEEFDPQVKESAEGLGEHVQQVLEATRSLYRQIRQILHQSNPSESAILNLASDLGSQKDALPRIWHLLRNMLRAELRQQAPADICRSRAERLLHFLEVEALTKERTLNPTLQLSAVLLRK